VNRITRILRIGQSGVWVAVCAGSLAAQAPTTWTSSGTVDFGFVSATGNTDVTTITVGEKVSGTRGLWTLSQTFAQVYGKTKGVESANQLRVGTRAERSAGKYFGAFAGAQFERNPFAGFDSRMEELVGVQWKPVTDSSNTLSFDAGALFTQQKNTDGTSDNAPSARTAMLFKHNWKPTTYFTQAAEYIANLTESGAYRLNTETALIAPLSARLGIKVSYVLRYDSRPPATFGTTDRIFTTGLQLTF
jgi:putative salt-induced outer membrane protein